MNDTSPDRRSLLELFPGATTPRLCDRVGEVLGTWHYSRRTEEVCVHWIHRFVREWRDYPD